MRVRSVSSWAINLSKHQRQQHQKRRQQQQRRRENSLAESIQQTDLQPIKHRPPRMQVLLQPRAGCVTFSHTLPPRRDLKINAGWLLQRCWRCCCCYPLIRYVYRHGDKLSAHVQSATPGIAIHTYIHISLFSQTLIKLKPISIHPQLQPPLANKMIKCFRCTLVLTMYNRLFARTTMRHVKFAALRSLTHSLSWRRGSAKIA